MAAFEQLSIDFDADPDEAFGDWLRRQQSTTWPDLRTLPLVERVKVARRLIQAEPGAEERAEILAAALWPGGAS